MATLETALVYPETAVGMLRQFRHRILDGLVSICKTVFDLQYLLRNPAILVKD